MSATLFTSSKYSATDAAGLPLAGGKVYTYRAGTLTPAETYTNQSGTTPNTNPIILDAAGRASVWLGPYAYRIIVKDANDVLMPDGDQDNIIAPLATIQLTDPITELMLGNGTANPLTLTQNPGSIDNLGWVLGGVSQTPGVDFTLSGVTVSPTSAVPSGVPGFFNYRVALPIGTTSASLVSFTQAGSAAVARDASDKLFDVVSLTDFMTSAQKADARTFLGLLDLSAVFQAAIDAIDTAGGGTVEIPPGRFRKLSTTTKATSKSIRIRGSGMGVTTIVKQGDSDCFAFTNTAGTSTFCFVSMTIAPATNMTTGAAISLRSDNVLPAVRMSNLFIGGSSGGEFKYGVKMKNCTEAQFDGVTVYGLNAANLIAFDLSCTVAATVPKWTKCSVYNALTGVNILSSTAPGIEGVQFYGTELVGVAQGVVYNNTVAAYAYFAPQFVWQGGHINASVDCINLTQMTQPIIQGGLFYNSGATGNHVKLTSCSGSNIQGQHVHQYRRRVRCDRADLRHPGGWRNRCRQLRQPCLRLRHRQRRRGCKFPESFDRAQPEHRVRWREHQGHRNDQRFNVHPGQPAARHRRHLGSDLSRHHAFSGRPALQRCHRPDQRAGQRDDCHDAHGRAAWTDRPADVWFRKHDPAEQRHEPGRLCAERRGQQDLHRGRRNGRSRKTQRRVLDAAMSITKVPNVMLQSPGGGGLPTLITYSTAIDLTGANYSADRNLDDE